MRSTTQAIAGVAALSACTLAAGAAFAGGDVFEKPVRIEAGGTFIDTDIGHAAPYLYDFDGDGVRDLLVGQFGEGKLRIYRNNGTNEAPSYQTHEWFKAGESFATVPAG